MDTRSLLARASGALARRDLAAADEDCRRILGLEPRNADAMHLLGRVRRQMGDVANAERAFRESLLMAPDRADFRINVGNFLRAQGRPRDAEAQYRIALELEPSSRPARLALARLLAEGKAFGPAEEEARQLAQRDPADAEAWAVLGAALRGLGRSEEAESAYRRSLELKPDYAIARHNLGALLGELGRAEESLSELDRAAGLGATGRALQFNRARALMELGRLDDTDAALCAALQIAPTDIESHVSLAKLRYMRGEQDYTRALETAIAAHPGNRELPMVLGDLLRRGGRPEAAEEVLRRQVAVQGTTPQLSSSLAVLLQERGRLDEAIAYARAAFAAQPADPAVIENLVAILLQRGEPAETWPLILAQRARVPLNLRWLAYEATAARLMGNQRYEELYDYARFVRPFDLEPPEGWSSIEAFNQDLIPRLVARHRFATHPLDQSLRLGSQTSRSLLDDPDPVLQTFIRALEKPIAAYRTAIGADPSHPHTARNRGRSEIVGCWSVRLRRGGYHVNHVHPEGWISSAYYVEVPSEVEDEKTRSGWIKFGEPRMPVPGADPAHFVKPKAGRLVLFPSYMWHGTMPIRGEEPRMTIAFDVVTREP